MNFYIKKPDYFKNRNGSNLYKRTKILQTNNITTEK